MTALLLLLLGFMLNALCFSYVFKRVGFMKHKTLSDHVATGPTRKIYIVGNSVATIFITVGLLIASAEATRFRLSLIAMCLISAISYFVVIYVPRSKEGLLVHDMAAIAFGTSFVLVLVGLFLNAELNEPQRIITALIISTLFSMGAYIYDKNRKNYAIIQSLFYILCFTGLCVVLI